MTIFTTLAIDVKRVRGSRMSLNLLLEDKKILGQLINT
jgi:hypothetical protein